jgi:hypothetical protein
MGVFCVIGEERTVVICVESSPGTAEAFHTSEIGQSPDGVILGEHEPMVKIQGGATRSSDNSVVTVVPVLPVLHDDDDETRIKENKYVYFEWCNNAE